MGRPPEVAGSNKEGGMEQKELWAIEALVTRIEEADADGVTIKALLKGFDEALPVSAASLEDGLLRLETSGNVTYRLVPSMLVGVIETEMMTLEVPEDFYGDAVQ
jgi:hypothetical protein